MVLEVKTHRRIALWASFVLVALLTWVVYLYLTALHSFLAILFALATIHFLLGLWLLIETRFTWRTVLLVALGLIVGQWWLILWSGFFLIWSIKGFAP